MNTLLVSLLLASSWVLPSSAVSVVTQSHGSDDDGITTVADAKNPKCIPWYPIRDAIMGGIYKGRCGDETRAAIRLAFHDAAPFSLALQKVGQPNGGADGSMLTDPTEVLRPDNNGLQTIVGLLTPMPAQFNVSPGDVLHLAGVLAVLACPGGPVINTYIGRPPPANNNPDGLLPNTHSPVSTLTARFADMGFSIREMMALIGSHTAGTQKFVDTTQAGATFDSTDELWDVRFYAETQSNLTAPGSFKLPSDVAFSHDPSTRDDYNRFVGNDRQDNWAREYADAHEKMSLLGQNRSLLTDCTELLPLEIDLGDVSSGANAVVDSAKLEAAIQKYRSIWLD